MIHPDELLNQALKQKTKVSFRVVPVAGRENNLAGLLTAEDIDRAYSIIKISTPAAPSSN